MSTSLQELYDNIIQSTIINVYSLSKTTKCIQLCDYNEKNKSHRCLLHICNIIHELCDFQIYIEEPNIIKKLKLKLKYGNTINIERKLPFGTSCDLIIMDIEKAYSLPGIYQRIYESYYEKGK